MHDDGKSSVAGGEGQRKVELPSQVGSKRVVTSFSGRLDLVAHACSRTDVCHIYCASIEIASSFYLMDCVL